MHQNVAFLRIKFQNFLGMGYMLRPQTITDTPMPGAGLAPSNKKFCVRPCNTAAKLRPGNSKNERTAMTVIATLTALTPITANGIESSWILALTKILRE